VCRLARGIAEVAALLLSHMPLPLAPFPKAIIHGNNPRLHCAQRLLHGAIVRENQALDHHERVIELRVCLDLCLELFLLPSASLELLLLLLLDLVELLSLSLP
jgi:hypothetical protein